MKFSFASISEGETELVLDHSQQRVIILQSSHLNTDSKLWHLPLPKTLRLQPQGEWQSSDLNRQDGL